MRRDLDLIRKIVLAIEDHPEGRAPKLSFEGYSREQVGYHNYLIVDAGLAHGRDDSTMGDRTPNWSIHYLTSAGHDFAEAARNENRWRDAMRRVSDTAGTVTIDVLKELLKSLMRGELGIGA